MTKISLVVTVVVGLIGCAGTFGEGRVSRPVRIANAVTGGMAAAATALDWCQTRSVASDGWSRGRSDDGMLGMTVGPTPTRYAVDAYFLGATAVLIGVTQSVPEQYRWVGHLIVAGVGFRAAGTSMWGEARTRCGPLGG